MSQTLRECQGSLAAVLLPQGVAAPFDRACPGVRLSGSPFDRLLVAQALSERIPIMTRDPAFAAYGVAVIW